MRVFHCPKALRVQVQKVISRRTFPAHSRKNVMHEPVCDMLWRVFANMNNGRVCHLSLLRINEEEMLTRLLGSSTI